MYKIIVGILRGEIMKGKELLKSVDLKKMNGTQISVCIICFLVSLFFTLQVRTINTSESDILRLKRENELRDEITQWKEVYEISKEKIDELNMKVEEYRKASSQIDSTVALMKQELDVANVLSGISAVKGPGITVELDDTEAIAEIHADAGFYDTNVYIIHDTDILSVINELSAAGAEAFSVNGQRIISTTAIRCVGPLIQINGISLSAPYTISAIGKPETLMGALNLRYGVIDEIKSAKIDVTIKKHNEITIPAYSKKLEYQYATPLSEVKK